MKVYLTDSGETDTLHSGCGKAEEILDMPLSRWSHEHAAYLMDTAEYECCIEYLAEYDCDNSEVII